MAKKPALQVTWLQAPEAHDYPAAKSYLSLQFAEKQVSQLVSQLKKAPRSAFKAKDIFRASGLSLLGISNSHLEADRRKIKKGQALSPLLLVRAPDGNSVIIADGYHRLCAVYQVDEDAVIPCHIV